MYDELLNKQLIEELKKLIEKANEFEEDRESFCEFMKGMILNTYSVN